VSRGQTAAKVLRAAIVVASLAGVAVTAFVAGALTVPFQQRMQHATLDAASVAARATLGNADRSTIAARIAALHDSLETWGLDAAAFDASGRFIAGDSALRSGGLPRGALPAPTTGRQLSVVPMRDGYVVLVPDPRLVSRQRAFLSGGTVFAFLATFALAWIAGGRWARSRAAAALRIARRLADDDAGDAAPLVVESDPVYGELSVAIADAFERRRRSHGERADDRDRLRAFLADAGHELRTPLAIAMGYVGILERGGLEDMALAKRIVGDVAEQHARLQHLVERILQLARLDASPPAPSASCDVAATLAEAVALVRPLAPNREIAIAADPARHAAIAADDLRDALRNVLENAVRYAPESAICASVALENGSVVVRVEDDGPGMDAFAAEHAFDRFYRGAEHHDVPGTGLGLAIVRRAAERAGGRVVLRSSAGAGTTVEIHLPQAAGRTPLAPQ
jgi:signal transduction histidine kinase